MMGKKKRVQPLALTTHHYVHFLNLTCGDWIRNATIVSKLLDASNEITKLVKFSPKRDSHLRKIHEEEYYQNFNDEIV